MSYIGMRVYLTAAAMMVSALIARLTFARRPHTI